MRSSLTTSASTCQTALWWVLHRLCRVVPPASGHSRPLHSSASFLTFVCLEGMGVPIIPDLAAHVLTPADWHNRPVP
jgi:hypothetical protein